MKDKEVLIKLFFFFFFLTSPTLDTSVALQRFPATCDLFGQLSRGQTFNDMICVR